MSEKIMFQGDAIRVDRIDGDIAEIVFDLKNDATNLRKRKVNCRMTAPAHEWNDEKEAQMKMRG